MFIQNKYYKWYSQIIEKAKIRDRVNEYSEQHHIIPRALGGNNLNENLVVLTAREHFICHLLLCRFTTGKEKVKMIWATAFMLANNQHQNRKYKITSRIYSSMKQNFSKNLKEYWTEDKRKQQSERMTGRTVSDETKEKLSQSLTGKIISKEARQNMSAAQRRYFQIHPGTFTGRKHSNATKEKIGRPKTEAQKLKQSLAMKGKHLGRIPVNKGKTLEEMFGQEEAKRIKDLQKHIGKDNGFFGKQHSEEQRKKKRLEKLNAPKLECPHCGKKVDHMNYPRWHGDKCKMKGESKL